MALASLMFIEGLFWIYFSHSTVGRSRHLGWSSDIDAVQDMLDEMMCGGLWLLEIAVEEYMRGVVWRRRIFLRWVYSSYLLS